MNILLIKPSSLSDHIQPSLGLAPDPHVEIERESLPRFRFRRRAFRQPVHIPWISLSDD